MRQFLVYSVFVPFVLIFCPVIFGQEDDENQADLVHAQKVCSIFENVLLNAEAWRTGDLLARQTSFVDAMTKDGVLRDDGLQIESETFFRIAFDFDRKRFCVLRWQKSDKIDLMQGEAAETTSVQMSGTSLDVRGHLYQRSFPDVATRSKIMFPTGSTELEREKIETEKFNEAADRYLIDYRLAGVNYSARPGSFKQLAEFLRLRQSAKDFSNCQETSDRLKIRFKTDLLKLDPESAVKYSIYDYVFDLENNLPVESESENTIVEKFNLPPFKAFTGNTKYIEFDGVFVPCEIQQQDTKTIREWNSNTQRRADRIVETKLHWFQFNSDEKELTKELFDGSCLSSMDAFMSFVDPVRSGATTLIEEKK